MTVIDRKLTAFKKCFWLFGGVCDKLKVIEKTQAARPALQGGQPVLPILLAVAMAALGYLTQTGKLTLFVTYYNPDLSEEEMQEMEAKRKTSAVRSLYLMGAAAAVSGVLSLCNLYFYKELFMGIYLGLFVRFLCKTFVSAGTKTMKLVFVLAGILTGFLYFSVSFTFAFSPNSYTVQDGTLVIAGGEKGEVLLSGAKITLQSELPQRQKAESQVKEFNGTFRGQYLLANGESAHLYLNGGSGCAVRLEGESGIYYFTGASDEETKELYALLGGTIVE